MTGRAALLLLLLAGAFVEPAAAEQPKSAAAVKAEEPPKLREADELALRGFVEKLAGAKRRLYEEEMEKLAKELAAETGLNDQASARLSDGFEKAIAAAMTGWEDKAYEWLAPYVSRSANAMRDMARWPVEQIARSPGVKDVTPPEEQPAWNDFLRSLLSDEQWRRWQEKLQRDAQEQAKRELEHVQFVAENQRPFMQAEADLAKADYIHTLGLDEDRTRRLDALAEKAVDTALAGWQEAALKTLREMDRERREAVVSHGGGLSVEGEFRPAEQAVWTAGLAELLTAEERRQVEEALAGRQQRRQTAARLALLQILDERLALTAKQREQADPLLDEAVAKLVSQMRRYYNVDPVLVGQMLRQCDLEPLRALLEPDQQRALDRLLDSPGRRQPDDEALRLARDLPPPRTEEDLERLLSADLLRRYDEVARERLEDMRLHLEDLRRQTRLTPEQMKTLKLAAHGAVQDSLELFRQQISTWLRQSLAGASGQMVRQRLLTLGTAGFGNEVSPKDTEFWQATLARVLDVFQQQDWRTALEARERELRRAQALLVTSELEHQLALTTAQAAFFEKRLGEIIQEYAEDLDQYRGARRWHLHAYSMLTPVAGIPEEELKKQLSAKQMELWQEKAENQVRHYWDGVKRSHENRLRARKEGGS